MNNRELCTKLQALIRNEREITNEILQLINIGLERRAYLELGYASMFDWLTKGFSYSNAAAYRRIEAAKMLKAVPEVKAKLESGEVNLSTLCKAQKIIKVQERVTGKKVCKEEIVKKIENKSTEEAERTLFQLMPESKSHLNQETRRVVGEDTTRHSMNFSKEMSENLKRAKEVLSHKFPNATDAEILDHVLKFFLEKKDPTSAAEAKRVKSARKITIRSSHGECTYQDPVSGRVCGGKYQIESDHIRPKAMGGGNNIENLRPLCKQHNLMMAEHAFGKPYMEKFRRA